MAGLYLEKISSSDPGFQPTWARTYSTIPPGLSSIRLLPPSLKRALSPIRSPYVTKSRPSRFLSPRYKIIDLKPQIANQNSGTNHCPIQFSLFINAALTATNNPTPGARSCVPSHLFGNHQILNTKRHASGRIEVRGDGAAPHLGGGRGIRTPETVTSTRLSVRRLRPLGHPGHDSIVDGVIPGRSNLR